MTSITQFDIAPHIFAKANWLGFTDIRIVLEKSGACGRNYYKYRKAFQTPAWAVVDGQVTTQSAFALCRGKM